MLYISNENHDNLLFLDCEFDKEELIQLAIFHFKKEKDNLYKLQSDINVYIKRKEVSYYCRTITNITSNFLENYGIDIENAKEIFNDYFKNIKGSILIIGHGIKQDINIIQKFGIILPEYDSFCTYTSAKVLFQDTKLSLEELSAATGFYLNSHDAHSDAMALIPVFSMIKEYEGE